MTNYDLSYKKFNPLAFHLMRALRDVTLRLIVLYGGSSSGKSYSVAQTVLVMTLFEGSNTLVMRKVGASIKDSIYEDFRTAAEQLGLSSFFEFKERLIRCKINGARIVFKGCDDAEKIKGLSNFKRVVLDEWSEFDFEDYRQIRLRLRGKEGQQIITTFNPINETHWIKTRVFDKQEWHDAPMIVTIDGTTLPSELTQVKSIRLNAPSVMLHKRTGEIIEHAPDTMVIQSTYLNNFWVVGSPDGTYGYYDEQCIATFEYDRIHDPDYYNIYALGEWGVIRSGSEFFDAFNRGTHCAEDVNHDPTLPIHISIDNNVLPYISCTFWQVDTVDGIHIRQIGELCATPPNNSARKAARLVAERLRKLGAGKVFLHGDASTRAASTLDEANRSFLDLFIDTLTKEGIEVVDCVGNKNPAVAMSGEFINSIFEGQLQGVDIIISEECLESIQDYLLVQKDVNGSILKTRIRNKITGQSYEEHGHLSDTFRYLVTDILSEEFKRFSNQRKRNLYVRNGALHFYNPATTYDYTADVVYAVPNVGSKFVMIHGKKCGERWHIVDAILRETASIEDIKSSLLNAGAETTILECGMSYFPFARELRKELSGVRVLPEEPDVDRRIAATSDRVKDSTLFNEALIVEQDEYAAFIGNLMDYRKDGGSKEASMALSGFAKFVVK